MVKVLRLDNHAAMFRTTADATITTGGNTVGRLGRCQTHLWPAVDCTRFTDYNNKYNSTTTIIHEAHRARSKHTGFSSFIALNNFILFHKHFFPFENLQLATHDSGEGPKK